MSTCVFAYNIEFVLMLQQTGHLSICIHVVERFLNHCPDRFLSKNCRPSRFGSVSKLGSQDISRPCITKRNLNQNKGEIYNWHIFSHTLYLKFTFKFQRNHLGELGRLQLHIHIF